MAAAAAFVPTSSPSHASPARSKPESASGKTNGRAEPAPRAREAAEEEVRAARAAGLRHVSDRRTAGLTRRATGRRVHQGRRSVPVFDIVDARGRLVRDEATLERIRRLAIPPAWTDVWICPDPRGHLQATGRDARGRKQYRYHPRWREERDSTKYERMIDFGRAWPRLRRAIAADLKLPGLPRRKVLATVVRLLDTTFIRVGNEEYERTNHSFGLTTLKDRHVEIGRGRVRFHFRGKSGVFHDISVHDPTVARIVRRCRDLPGQELFQYLDEDGRPASLGSSDVNDYIHELAGHDFTAKDIRTWAGTVLAAAALHTLVSGGAVTKERTRPGRRAEAGRGRPSNRDVTRAIEQVAERLGNTAAVCRKCYVHPHVVASFLDGTLSDAFARLPRAPRATTGLHPDERAVLALLRRRAAAEKTGTLLEGQLRRSLQAHRPRRPPARRRS
ncbi:MAG TPA: DNA topoisomerase IB [Polyangia bacterium]